MKKGIHKLTERKFLKVEGRNDHHKKTTTF